MRSPTMAKLADAYYTGYNDRHSHYSRARYHALNLHNLWDLHGGETMAEQGGEDK